MKLYLMRHGPAEDRASSGRDGDRALTHEGALRVQKVAQKLIDHGEAPKEILTSPLVRAYETAKLVAEKAFAEGERSISQRSELSIAGADVRHLVNELLAAGRRRVMLVGHEPSLSDFVEADLGIRLPAGMGKAMVIGVRVRPNEAGVASRSGWEVRPRFMLEPKSLAWMEL